MTYFAFHLRFLLPPILVLGLLVLRDYRRGKRLPAVLRRRSAGLALLINIALAVIYTTPWDNYLVATRVWWYDPAGVTGVTLGWVAHPRVHLLCTANGAHRLVAALVGPAAG